MLAKVVQLTLQFTPVAYSTVQ